METDDILGKKYKVELKLDLENLSVKDRDDLCKRTDDIFAVEELECKTTSSGRRIYYEKGNAQSYGKFWAALFQLKTAKDIAAHLKECNWYNGEEKENLLMEFINKE